ncbi:hypothetical protein [Micromonospora arborensis]|nr:hypothetical protein [Micromonospora arborensis]
MVIVREVVDGRKVALFEPGGAVYVDGPLRPRVAALLPEHIGIVAALAVVGDEVGADLDRATLEGPLATALSLLNEPPAGEGGRRGTPESLGPSRRLLATMPQVGKRLPGISGGAVR